ncbi:MAG: hypothetical protein GX028_08020 [Clostridiaceae bacterium]|nr:hypothetical protein [Clostridiaceae bacterium]
MPIADVTQAAQTAAQTSQLNRNVKNELGKDEFLKILVTQLQNQDPMSPMEDTDFIAQLAQFSTLEQMQSLNTSYTFGQAYNLIGKNVFSTITNDQGIAEDIFGKVTGVLSSKGAAYLEIDAQSYIPFTNDVVVYEVDVDNIETTPPTIPEEQTADPISAQTNTQTTPAANTQTSVNEPGTAEIDSIEADQEIQNNTTTAASGTQATQEVISLGDPTTRVMDY